MAYSVFEHEEDTEGWEKKWSETINPFLTSENDGFQMANQRVTRGYSDKDLWDIDSWFLHIIPDMLQQFKDTRHGSPGCLGKDYVDERGILRNDTCHEEWDKILDEMIHLFRESVAETCSKTNPYVEEHLKAMHDFDEKYGFFGEKLLTESEKEKAEKTGCTRWHFMDELPEYQEISEKYRKVERELEAYRADCLQKAMALFSKWLPYLWD